MKKNIGDWWKMGVNDIEMKSVLCESCGLLVRLPKGHCPRCESVLHQRKPGSLSRTLAFNLTALIMYLPANLMPILIMEKMGRDEPSTILGGIAELFSSGMWFIGLVVFVASVLVPIFKIMSIFYLLLSMKINVLLSEKMRLKLFHLIEFIGKWSMLDIYVVTILAGIVNIGFVLKVRGGPAAVPFAAVVVFTMFAAKAFDTRLLWDKAVR